MSCRSVFRPHLFRNQTIIVTGGGSGIGRCTAHELVSLGATVAIIGRNPGKLASVQAEVADAGGQCSIHACDIRDEAAVKASVRAILDAHGAIHGLVNNAGGQFPAPLKNISFNGWEAVVRNNLTGGFLFARECYNQWMEAHGGAIVNIIADIWGGMPTIGHSGAARAGMLPFTETAACEWAHSGVRINAVAPGFIASSGFDTIARKCRPSCIPTGTRFRCIALAPNRKLPRQLFSCCLKRRRSLPAPACAWTVARPMRARPGNSCRMTAPVPTMAFRCMSRRNVCRNRILEKEHHE